MTPDQQYQQLLQQYNGNHQLASLAMSQPAMAQYLSTPQQDPNVSPESLRQQFNQAQASDSGVLTQPGSLPASGGPVSRTIPQPILSQPGMPERPESPTYGGNVGLSMFQRSMENAAKGGPGMYAGLAQGYNEHMGKQFEADMIKYKDEMGRYDTGVKRYNEAVKKQKENKEQLAKDLIPYQEQLGKLRNVRERMQVQGGGLTGIDELSDFNRIKDKFVDEPVANQRKLTRRLLNDIGVDYTLLKIAQTKGAISNKEMDLFMTPVPNMNSSEGEWELWLNKQIQAMESTIMNMERISSGQMQPIQQDYSSQINSLLADNPATSSDTPASTSNAIKIEIKDGKVQ